MKEIKTIGHFMVLTSVYGRESFVNSQTISTIDPHHTDNDSSIGLIETNIEIYFIGQGNVCYRYAETKEQIAIALRKIYKEEADRIKKLSRFEMMDLQ